MDASFTLEELSKRVTDWCDEHDVIPASGQAGAAVTERNIRYYRTLGLVDSPAGSGYTEKHLLQLMAIRLLQAQGLPLRRIRELLYGRSVDDLREIQRRGLEENTRIAGSTRIVAPVSDELWRVTPLDEDFLLMSRRGTPLTPEAREAVLAALHATDLKPPTGTR